MTRYYCINPDLPALYIYQSVDKKGSLLVGRVTKFGIPKLAPTITYAKVHDEEEKETNNMNRQANPSCPRLRPQGRSAWP
jgi:hypothetical protein